MITQDQLKSEVTYDPLTGNFFWVDPKRGKRPGNIAGGIGFHGYVLLRLACSKKLYRCHRLAWLYVYGELPDCDIDHINNVRHDNRIENLRLISRSGNLENLKVATKKSKSGILGVSWCAKSKKWRAFICVKGKRMSLGSFNDTQSAHQAYLEAKRRLHAACTI